MAVNRCWLGAVCCLAGCIPVQMTSESKTATVSSNPFGLQAESRAAKVSFQSADETLATSVDAVGRKLLAANPQIGLKSTLFATIGKSQHPEVFHTGPSLIYVTEGLVRRCANEAELAAVLAVELGKIVAEREAAATPDMRNPDRLPPIQVPIGNAGQFIDTDLVQQVERVKFEKERPRTRRPLPRPDANVLARGYLEKAGYQSSDLDAAQPLLRAAENHAALERQFKGTITPNAWNP